MAQIQRYYGLQGVQTHPRPWHGPTAERSPEVFLFVKQGQLRYHGAIDDNYDHPEAVKDHYLRAALDAVLGVKPLSVSETPPVGCTIKWK